MSYHYTYFIGCIILAIVWLAAYFLRKDLRKEILFGSFIALPFGITEVFYVPEYWNPKSLFNLIEKNGIGIEDFLYTFFIGGIASVVYEIVNRKKEKKLLLNWGWHFWPYITFFIIFIALEMIYPSTTAFNSAFALIFCAVLIGCTRKDLIKQTVLSGAYFAVAYFVLFLVLLKIFNGFITSVYNLKNLWGIYLFGIPIEEIIFAFAFGACWSTLYEYIRGYKTKSI